MLPRSLEPLVPRPPLSGRCQQRLVRIVRRHEAGRARTPWQLLLPESPTPIRPQRRWLSRKRGADGKQRRSRHRNFSMMHADPRPHALCGGVMGGLSMSAACGGVMGGLSMSAACGGVMGGLSIRAACGGVIGGLSNIAKAELAIAQPAIKATRLTFMIYAPIFQLLKGHRQDMPARCPHRYKRHLWMFPLILDCDICLGENLNP